MNGTLSIVATPIGNLGDITVRALQTLKNVDIIACEDTRVTSVLLAHYEISKPKIALHARSGDGAYDKVLAQLRKGSHVAYVSDAGTPGIHDPGSYLVARVVAELPDCAIEAIPGPSAVTALLSIAGFHADEYLYLGFMPHKKGRQTRIMEILSSERTVVYFDTPHRVVKNLQDMVAVAGASFGDFAYNVCVGRELTKHFQSCYRGSLQKVLEAVQDAPQKGEYVIALRRKKI